jgi:hypothetical protein
VRTSHSALPQSESQAARQAHEPEVEA